MTTTLAATLQQTPLASPKGYPLIGHALSYRRNPLGFYSSIAQQGDMVRLHFGSHPIYFLNHPDLIKEVFVTCGTSFLARAHGRESQLFGPLFGNGLSVSEGRFWRRQRRLTQPIFQRQYLGGYADIAVELTRRLTQTWHNGETIAVRDVMMRLTRQIIAQITFGSAGLDQFELITTALDAALQEYGKRDRNWLRYLLPEQCPTPSNHHYQSAVRRLDSWIYDLIIARQQQPPSGDMLSVLQQVQDEFGQKMTHKELRDELVNVVVGHDPIADVFCWAWWLIAQHPQVEARLQSEWQAVLQGRPPTMADLPRLVYTEQVIKETLRLYPLAWSTGRIATQDCEIGHHPIHAGENVVMCQWVTHRDPRFFPNPEAFLPDRWEPQAAKAIPTHAYFPFGGGPRVCIGRGLTMLETVLLLADIGQHFQLRPLSDQPVEPQPGPSFSLRPKSSLQMQITAR